MNQTISKSQFKGQMLEYLRIVEKDKKPLVITHGGKPVVTITPFTEDPDAVLKSLRGTVISYKDPFEPVGQEDWEALK